MKLFRLLVNSLAFILVLAVLAAAQTEKTQPVKSDKIAIISFDAFKDRKTGIKELADAYEKLEIEFKPQKDELKLLAEKIQKAVEELKKINMVETPPYLKEFTDGKIDEYGLIACKYKDKLKEVRTLYQKRELEITAEIEKKIVEALNQFAKEKGYAFILDFSKLPTSFISAKPDNDDVTEEFIKFYNENFGNTKSQ